jgi:hypothetical protein
MWQEVQTESQILDVQSLSTLNELVIAARKEDRQVARRRQINCLLRAIGAV